MKKLLLPFYSFITGAFFAFLLTFSLPATSLANGTCSEECDDLCGAPGNVACQGITCENGSTVCTKYSGEPGLPGEGD